MSLLSPEDCRRRLDRGLIPAVPVPFRATGEIDAAAQGRYVAYMSREPAVGVAVWAHTGRGLNLTRDQRVQVLRAWSEGLGRKKIVVAGVGGSPRRTPDFSAFVASSLDMARDALEELHFGNVEPRAAAGPDRDQRSHDAAMHLQGGYDQRGQLLWSEDRQTDGGTKLTITLPLSAEVATARLSSPRCSTQKEA